MQGLTVGTPDHLKPRSRSGPARRQCTTVRPSGTSTAVVRSAVTVPHPVVELMLDLPHGALSSGLCFLMAMNELQSGQFESPTCRGRLSQYTQSMAYQLGRRRCKGRQL